MSAYILGQVRGGTSSRCCGVEKCIAAVLQLLAILPCVQETEAPAGEGTYKSSALLRKMFLVGRYCYMLPLCMPFAYSG